MPDNLVIIRHGHSEGNLVVDASKEGDESLYTPDFRELPGSKWRLTAEGRQQAQITGNWILNNLDFRFDRYYSTSYIRGRETAGLLALEGANWRLDQRLRERDWGDIGSLPRTEYIAKHPENSRIKDTDGLYWRPPGGESIADVRQRVRNFFDTLHRECPGKNVVAVAHGEFMWAVRSELEYMTDEKYATLEKDKSQKILNTQIIHYSRLDPKTGYQARNLQWVRNITAWKEDSDTGWQHIPKREIYTNEELLRQVEEVEPIIGIL